MSPQFPEGPKVMIVDDTPANLKLLEDILRERGYEVSAFPRGRLALTAIHDVRPDVILMDINMPEMDGYQTCSAIKAMPQHEHVPVVFISALGEMQDKLRAFDSGGVDFLTKPFQVEEVIARVEIHLRIRKLQKELEAHNDKLERAVSDRTHELALANERLHALDDSKNAFLGLISHELRTPLNGLFGAGELLISCMEQSPENLEIEGLFRESADRLLGIVDDAMLLTNISMGRDFHSHSPMDLEAALIQSIESASPMAEQRGIKLRMSTKPGERLHAAFDPGLFQRAMQALLDTALKFATQSVGIGTRRIDRQLQIEILVEGNSVPDAVLPSFFELLGVSEADTAAGHLGLHPALAQRVFRLFGGDTRVVNTSDGMMFTAVMDAWREW